MLVLTGYVQGDRHRMFVTSGPILAESLDRVRDELREYFGWTNIRIAK